MPLQEKHRKLRQSVKRQRKLLLLQLNSVGKVKREELDNEYRATGGIDVIAAIRERVEILADKAKLTEWSDKLRDEFKDVFNPLPHYDDLSDEIHCKINLKDASQTIKTRSYSCLMICIWTLWTRRSIFLHIPVINTSTLSLIPTLIYTQYCHDDLRQIFAISGSRFRSFLRLFNRIKSYLLLVAQIPLSVFFLRR